MACVSPIFIDEGFGTLDAEKLDIVPQILYSLGQQNRLVGIITHVSSLADKLPVQIQVENSPATGFQIRVR